MSLVLDVNGLSTCMAHPLTEDAHLREGEAGVFLLSRFVVPIPSEEKPNGVLSPKGFSQLSRPSPPGVSGPPRSRLGARRRSGYLGSPSNSGSRRPVRSPGASGRAGARHGLPGDGVETFPEPELEDVGIHGEEATSWGHRARARCTFRERHRGHAPRLGACVETGLTWNRRDRLA